MQSSLVKWPAIIHYQGDDELIYVASRSEWEQDPDLHGAIYAAADRLIDSSGRLYSLGVREESALMLSVMEDSLELEEMLELLRAHFSVIGECCVAKFSISSIAEGITTVGQFEAR